jgi:AAA15 family ATPase/GTPase
VFIEFSVANFRSILTRQTLSMVASVDKAHRSRNVVETQDRDLALNRSSVIYGPNAAGKSNLLRALQTLQQLVQLSAGAFQEGQALPVRPFLFAAASDTEATEFEIVFVAEDRVRYQYGCILNAERVFKEWLIAYPQGRAQRWFEREWESEQKTGTRWWFGPNFKGDRAERKVWQDFTRANALFLSTAIQLNNAQLKPVFNWLTQKLIVLGPQVQFNPFLSLELLRGGAGLEKLMGFMCAADVGIDRLELHEEEVAPAVPGPVPPGAMRLHVELPPGVGIAQASNKRVQVLAWHNRDGSTEQVPLDLVEESDGTQKLFEFAGGWLRALESGAALFVDELDRSLHPHITRFLVERFHSQHNDRNAQLVFTTHDTTLLDSDLMRRDQVWFVEKDSQRASHLYSLLDYSPRKDEALERGYLKGRYGAIPFVGNWDR